MKLSRLFIMGCAVVTVLGYQNCSKVEFSAAEEAASASGTPTGEDPLDPPTVPPVDINDALDLCQRNAGKMKVSEVPISFGNPLNEVGSAPVCAWDQAGNVSVNNGYMTARYIQSQSVNIPSAAVVCGIEFEFATQAMRYDDNFFFLINNYIVAANEDYWQTNYMQSQAVSIGGRSIDLTKFEWDKIVSKPNYARANLPAGKDFCLGAAEGLSQCNWPETETLGSISMSVDKDITTALALAGNSRSVKFDFITTGDDDTAIDCQHEPLSFKVKIRYLE